MKPSYDLHVKQHGDLWTEYSALPESEKETIFDRKVKRVNKLANNMDMT